MKKVQKYFADSENCITFAFGNGTMVVLLNVQQLKVF